MSFLPAAPFSFRQQKREVASRCSLLLSVVTLFVCGPLAATEPSAANSPPSGFVALFNGQDLSGWQGLVQTPAERAALSPEKLAAAQQLADESMREHWRVEDGVLAFDGAGHNLCTVRDYENFELYVDWKIVPDGISGIYLRGAPQVQICDPARSAKNRVGSGGLFNNKQHPDEPLVTADNPVGQWNTFYILMIGERVTVTLNGKLVVDDVVLENYWDRGKPIYATGPIELQSHGNPVYFRNIFLRELPHHPSPSWENLFDGTDLDRWDYRRRGGASKMVPWSFPIDIATAGKPIISFGARSVSEILFSTSNSKPRRAATAACSFALTTAWSGCTPASRSRFWIRLTGRRSAPTIAGRFTTSWPLAPTPCGHRVSGTG